MTQLALAGEYGDKLKMKHSGGDMMQQILRLVRRGDMYISGNLSSWASSSLVSRFFHLVTHLADPMVILLFPVLLVFFGAHLLPYSLILLLCLLINFSLTTAMKGVWGRPRPKKILYNQDSPKGFYNQYAFPSGHTSAAFTVATFYAAVFPQGAILWFVIASLVGLSRVYLNEHFMSDIIVGAAIGCGITLLAVLALP